MPPSTETLSDTGLRALDRRMSLVRGHRLAGRYVIEAKVGRGATGQVFKAFDRATKTHVALKLVHPEIAGRRSSLERLGREVRHARDVQHPNVCRIFELIESDGFTFFTMELATGSLRATLERKKRRPLAERMADARAVAAGLAAVHAAGIVHRDLKPENVLRMPDGRLVVSDFGLALHGDSTVKGSAGTRGYIAPEVLKGRAATTRSDVWALGIVLREVHFGRSSSRSGGAPTYVERSLMQLCEECTDALPAKRPADAGVVRSRLDDLDGETLEDRLQSGPLSIPESLRLAARVFGALAEVHQSKAVHGAVAPSNIFLGRVDQTVRLLASKSDAPRANAVSRAYLSPEAARGIRDIDGRTDVFSVGCVLFECLTGRRPEGDLPATRVFARRSLGETAHLSLLGSDFPAAVAKVLKRLLTADRVHRPSDAGALATELRMLADALATAKLGARGRSPPALAEEQRLSCTVALSFRDGRDEALRWLRREVEPFDVRLDDTSRRRLFATLLGPGTPTDLAAAAARCALAMKGRIPGARIAVVTTRAVLGDGEACPQVKESASALLKGARRERVGIDSATADLLGPTFEISGKRRLSLQGERPTATRPRTVLGKETPCIGRDRELATLLGLWDECSAESVARAVLMIASAGGGKTRVRLELLERLHLRPEPFTHIVGRGEALRAGAPFGLLGPALRTWAGIVGNEALPWQQSRLLSHVSRTVRSGDVKRVAAFLGEIAGVHFSADALPWLAAARQDARLMADQILAAWLDFIEAECSAGPVLLVLEDLHWGDTPSVQLVDAALRTSHDRPLLVLALARPEVDERFPTLWTERALQRIALAPLTSRAAQKLVRHVLGEVDEERIAQIVDRADGNPLFLEEILRSRAPHLGTTNQQTLPESIIGTVQARFDGIGDGAKRVLRAASIFGETFNSAGVEAVLQDRRGVADYLDQLIQREIVYARRGSEGNELAFRHALLQQAAYDMLTPRDRKVGHRCAARYLEEAGERQAILLVEHYRRGGERQQAVLWSRMAANQAKEANDLGAVIERARRGVACGAKGRVLGELRLLEAQARIPRGEYREAEWAARRAMRILRGAEYFHAVDELVSAFGQQGHFHQVEKWGKTISKLNCAVEDRPAWLSSLVMCAAFLLPGGQMAFAGELIAKVEPAKDLLVPNRRQRLEFCKAWIAAYYDDWTLAISQCEKALFACESVGEACLATEMLCALGTFLADLGLFAEAEKRLNEAVTVADRLGIELIKTCALVNLAMVGVGRMRPTEALAAGAAARDQAQRQGDPRVEGCALTYLSLGASLAGSHADAETHARLAMKILKSVPPILPGAIAALAQALLRQGRIAEAVRNARAAYLQLETMGRVEDGEARIRRVYAECLLASGKPERAREVLRKALRRFDERSARLDKPEWRATFAQMPEHVWTHELADRVRLRSSFGRRTPLLQCTKQADEVGYWTG